MKIATGDRKPHTIKPTILEPEFFKHHPAVHSLAHNGQAVVMWTEGAVHTENLGGDSIRDGSSGRTYTDMSKNFLRYCTQEDWVAAGYKLPGE